MECPSVQQVFITAMMLYSVKHPAKYIQLQKSKTIKRVIPVMILTLVAINMPSLVGFKLAQDPAKLNNNSSTDLDCFASDEFTITLTITTLLVRYFIPFVLIFVMNIFIIKCLRQTKILFPNAAKRRGSRKNFLMSIIIVNTLFFILYSPMTILFSLIAIDYLKGVEFLSQTMLISYNLTISLSYINNLTPFFVHLVFNSLFKKNAKKEKLNKTKFFEYI
jgi:hypothetical protein